MPDDALDPQAFLEELVGRPNLPVMVDRGLCLALSVPQKADGAPGGCIGWQGGPVAPGALNPPLWWSQGLFHGRPGLDVQRVLSRALGVVAVVADDVGSKAWPLPAGIPVFARIGTRPPSADLPMGNEQWVLAFADVPTVAGAEEIQRLLVAGGWTDASGENAVRLARLPGSQPKGKPAPARLVELSPAARWPVAQVIGALRESLTPAQREAFESGGRAAANAAPKPAEGLTGTWAEIAAKDALFAWLHSRGDVFGRSGVDGWWDIRCPWAQEHSKPPGVARYQPQPGGGFFKCWRGGEPGHVAQRARAHGYPSETALFRAWANREMRKG